MRMTRNRSGAIDLGNTEWPKVDTTRKTHQEKLATLQFLSAFLEMCTLTSNKFDSFQLLLTLFSEVMRYQ